MGGSRFADLTGIKHWRARRNVTSHAGNYVRWLEIGLFERGSFGVGAVGETGSTREVRNEHEVREGVADGCS